MYIILSDLEQHVHLMALYQVVIAVVIDREDKVNLHVQVMAVENTHHPHKVFQLHVLCRLVSDGCNIIV